MEEASAKGCVETTSDASPFPVEVWPSAKNCGTRIVIRTMTLPRPSRRRVREPVDRALGPIRACF
jgi:hypothetical protein